MKRKFILAEATPPLPKKHIGFRNFISYSAVQWCYPFQGREVVYGCTLWHKDSPEIQVVYFPYVGSMMESSTSSVDEDSLIIPLCTESRLISKMSSSPISCVWLHDKFFFAIHSKRDTPVDAELTGPLCLASAYMYIYLSDYSCRAKITKNFCSCYLPKTTCIECEAVTLSRLYRCSWAA